MYIEYVSKQNKLSSNTDDYLLEDDCFSEEYEDQNDVLDDEYGSEYDEDIYDDEEMSQEELN